MDALNAAAVHQMFAAAAAAMTAHCEYLCAIDAQAGDGDLGCTLRKGFQAFSESLNTSETEDIGEALSQAALDMLQAAPSTMGALMACGILTGARRLQGVSSMGPAEFAAFLDGVAEGVQRRGQCRPGDCTVLDALAPAARGAARAAAAGADLPEAALAAARLAEDGVRATAAMERHAGKTARRSGAAGRPDQGAVAASILIQSFYEFLAQ